MKRLIILIMLLSMLTGCSSVQKQSEINIETPELATEAQPATPETAHTADNQPAEDNQWFAGYIGSEKIHAKFDIKGENVTGVFYYDKDKTERKLKGEINDYLKGYQVIYLDDETANNKGNDEESNFDETIWNFGGIFKSKDYIEGFYKSSEEMHPMYLIREGTDITPPKQPSAKAMKLDGQWTGKNSSYFVISDAMIHVLFDDLLYFHLYAQNGLATGGMSDFGIIENNVSTAVSQNEFETASFEFSLNDNLLILASDNYSYGCGAGVEFDSEYVKGKIDIPTPTALDVGIVDTKEQDELFEKIVGDRYNEFISNTSHVMYDEYTLDGQKVKAGASYLRGYSCICYYIISPEHIYAAIIGDESIDYYTNDINYADTLPELMTDWASRDKITYHYVDCSLQEAI